MNALYTSKIEVNVRLFKRSLSKTNMSYTVGCQTLDTVLYSSNELGELSQ